MIIGRAALGDDLLIKHWHAVQRGAIQVVRILIFGDVRGYHNRYVASRHVYHFILNGNWQHDAKRRWLPRTQLHLSDRVSEAGGLHLDFEVSRWQLFKLKPAILVRSDPGHLLPI